jgi:hypothetical protein
VIPIAYRAADFRRYFEPRPRLQAHRLPMAHRDPAPESLWRAVAVLGVAFIVTWFLVTVVLG